MAEAKKALTEDEKKAMVDAELAAIRKEGYTTAEIGTGAMVGKGMLMATLKEGDAQKRELLRTVERMMLVHDITDVDLKRVLDVANRLADCFCKTTSEVDPDDIIRIDIFNISKGGKKDAD